MKGESPLDVLSRAASIVQNEEKAGMYIFVTSSLQLTTKYLQCLKKILFNEKI